MSSKKYGKPHCLFKSIISAAEYLTLATHFEDKGDWSQSFYLYFDTSENRDQAELHGRKLRLRVRSKEGKYSLELKSCQDDKHWETSQDISFQDFRLLFLNCLPEGEIKRNLSLVQLRSPFACIGLSNTVRKKIYFQNGILVLDQTNCGAKIKYEIEFRSDDFILPTEVQLIRDQLNLLMRSHQAKIEELFVG